MTSFRSCGRVVALGVLLRVGLKIGGLVQAEQNSNNNGQSVLTASSIFKMLLQPTSVELDSSDLKAVTDATSATILLFQPPDGQAYSDAAVVVQQTSSASTENSTTIQFYVLGTQSGQAATSSSSSIGSRKAALDAVIASVFESLQGKSTFLDFIQSDPRLDGVAVVDVTQTQPTADTPSSTTATTTSSSSDALTGLDIFLIGVSGAIFIGIMYMIIQHHKDRGYIENIRLRVMNGGPPLHLGGDNASNEEVQQDQPSRKSTDMDDEKGPEDSNPAPSTPSTTTSLDVLDGHNPESPERVVRITATTATTEGSAVSRGIVSPSQWLSTSTFTAAVPVEAFDSKWFAAAEPKKADHHGAHGEANEPVVVETVAQGGENASSSDGSQDVFHIDTTTPSSAPSSSSVDEVSSRASSTSTVTEWLRTIRVVPSDGATNKTVSEMSRTSQENSSTESTIDHSSLDLSSLEQISLEKSIASSRVGPAPAPSVPVSRRPDRAVEV